jgi:hypothetical protein
MAHCPPARLKDLASLLADLRRWPGVVERSRAVFYARRQPLLHFHLTREGARRESPVSERVATLPSSFAKSCGG